MHLAPLVRSRGIGGVVEREKYENYPSLPDVCVRPQFANYSYDEMYLVVSQLTEYWEARRNQAEGMWSSNSIVFRVSRNSASSSEL
jgi:hypothetical protein